MCLLFPPAFRAWYYIRVRPAYHACVLALFASHPATLSAHQSESRAASIHLLPIHWAHHTPRRPPASARKKEDAVTTGGVGSISAPNGRRIIYPGVGGDLPAAVALRPRRAPPLRRRMRKKDRDLPAGPAISGTGHAHSGGWEKAGGVQRAHTCRRMGKGKEESREHTAATQRNRGCVIFGGGMRPAMLSSPSTGRGTLLVAFPSYLAAPAAIYRSAPSTKGLF